MRSKLKQLLILTVVFLGLPLSLSLSAQTYIRYVNPDADGMKVLCADSVSTSLAMTCGVYRLHESPDFTAAAQELSAIMHDPDIEIVQVWICGSASPDGLWGDNVRLSQARTDAAATYFMNATGIPAHLIHRESLNEDWKRLAEQVSASNLPCKNEVLHIIRTKSWGERKIALQKLDGGRIWKALEREFFPDLRGVRFAVFCKETPEPQLIHQIQIVRDTMCITDTVYVEKIVYAETPAVEADNLQIAQQQEESALESYMESLRQPKVWDTPWLVGLKTNLLADFAVIGNIGFQVQLSENISLGMTGGYTNRNVFYPAAERTGVDETKVYGFQPEIRYWFDEVMTKGHSIGLHSNILWYTIKCDKTTLCQNISNDSPAWMVGIDYGYTVPLSRNGRWGLEFVIGLGGGRYTQDKAMYSADDNKWYSILEEPESGTYLGITRAGINLAYRFSVRKYAKTN